MTRITIFGLAGTGTSSAGRALAARLSVEFLSPSKFFREQAARLGLDLYQFEALCMKEDKYDRELDTLIADYGRTHDAFVVESRLAWYFIPDSFKVKFICDTDERLRRVALRDGLSIDEAREKTFLREGLGRERYQSMYGINEFAPDNAFDLIVDTTHIGVDEVVERIVTAIEEYN